MTRFVLAIFGAALLLGSVHARSNEPRPINRMAKEVGDVLARRDFNELERLARTFRDNNVPLSDGQPALSAFYAGVAKCVEMSCGDESLPLEAWTSHKGLLDEWISTNPESMTAKLALAVYQKEYGWFARRLGMSNTVSKMQRDLFNARLDASLALLNGIGENGKKDPIWYDTMLSIGKVQGWPRSRLDQLFAEGIGKFPYYLPLYFSKASALSPKWGGSLPAFRAFVDESVRVTQEQLGETMYARLNWSEYDPEMFENGQTDWNRMKAGFIRMTNDYPDPWNTNNFAKFACVARDIPVLRNQLKRMGDSPIMAAWKRVDFYLYCKGIASAGAKP